MQEKPDAQLLRAYVAGDESAFREIVSRHTDLVYSAALRQTNSQPLAQDIAQSVFVDLVRKSREVSARMTEDASLAGWLYRSTRFAALTHLRNDRRRAEHERQAMEQLITNSSPSAEWERIRPLLDEAMAELNDEDRDALLLRYFKNQNFQTVGRALGVSDDAAQKRVTRAVERLRQFLSQRGIAIGASGLVVLISANAVHAAPIALAASISTAALLTGTTIHASTALTATKAITMTLFQKTLVTATVTVIVGAGLYQTHQATQLRHEVLTLEEQQAPLTAQIQQLQQERDAATNQVAALTEEAAKASNDAIELLKLRGEVGALRQQLSQHSTTGAPARGQTKAADAPAGSDAAGQLVTAIAQGDPTALQRLNDFAKSRSDFYRTNSIGLQADDRAGDWTLAFGGIMNAFDSLYDEAAKGNVNARKAIEEATRMSNLQGAAVSSLGKIAGTGDDEALQILLNPEKNGFLLASAVPALQPAADNGNEKAIEALAAILKDPKDKPLWLMASTGLQKAAANGNATAIDALNSIPQRQ